MTLPWFKLMANDWTADTAHLSCVETGAFIRLLCAIWRNAEKTGSPSVRDNDSLLAKLAGVTLTEWRRIRLSLIGDGPDSLMVSSEGLVWVEWLSNQYETTVSFKRGRSEWMKRLNETKPQKQPVDAPLNGTINEPINGTINVQYARACQSQNQNQSQNQTPNQVPSEPDSEEVTRIPTLQGSMCMSSESHTNARATENATDETTTAVAVIEQHPVTATNPADDFERFIAAYPKHRARGAAYDAWKLLHRTGKLPPIETILADIERHIQLDPNWRTERFTPNPARYLTDELWHDQYNAPRDNALIQALAEGR